ncbi:MAG: beta-lactamase family protein, partial [Oscillospiraceae bacterium]|nr:beta-lactamase family protein [Oscillospiraceae bacterium]
MNALSIPRAKTPGEAGISPQALALLMQDVIDEGLDLHSIMVVRRGQVAYEAFRKPYGPGEPHTLFSTSKSITAIAVGFAVEEGKLGLHDKVADLVPELREFPHENWDKLEVVHLLRMSAGKHVNYLADKRKKQWIRDYARGKWEYAPGEGFNYCNENCYMLCVILHRVCGESVVDFLMPRLFGPLGIHRPFWETDGHGVETGGWGLYLATEDLAKIGLCCIRDGKYGDRQVIPARWVSEMSRPQTDTAADRNPSGCRGYGYGVWMNPPPGGFRMDGLFAQFVFMFPAYDACIVTTGGEGAMHDVMNAVFRRLPALFEEDGAGEGCEIPSLPAYPPLDAAPRNEALEARLEGRIIRFPETTQRLPVRMGFPLSVIPGMIFFMSADKAGGIDRVRFRFGSDSVKFSWSEGAERNTVLCGMDGRARKCKITLGGVEFVMSCSAAWEGDVLRLRLRCLTSVAERRLAFRFRGRGVSLLCRSSPGLDCLRADSEKFARENIPLRLSDRFITGAVDTVLWLVEPPMFGY